MKKFIFGGLAGLFLMVAQLSATQLTYLGTLGGNGDPFIFGSVVGSGSANCGLCGHGDLNTTDLLDFWRVEVLGSGPQTVTITGLRIDANLDLAFVLYAGMLPEFPLTPLDSSLRNGKKIWQDGSPLGLTILAIGDDELAFGGGACILTVPFCDPSITILLSPGFYTLAVSSGTGSGTPVLTLPDNYFISINGGTAGDLGEVPEPSTYLMMGTGLAGLFALARCRKSA